MNLEESIHISIIRLFTGEASSEEMESVRGWLSQSQENRNFYHDLNEIWLGNSAINNADQFDFKKANRQFREKVRKEKKVTAKRIVFIQAVKYAAIALLLLALPLSFYLGNKTATIQDSVTTITCAFGDKTFLILPDSSEVWLNSGSKLTFNNNFKKGERQVYLEGEAFFSVTKDKKNPFRVKTNDINIEVLGTEFDLKAYSDEKDVSATLVEGTIKIASAYQQTVIKPNQKLIYNKENKKMKLYGLSDTSPETEWKDGRLVFQNETLEELKMKLERWFDVEIVFADEAVSHLHFTGILEHESILETVSYFGRSRYLGYRIHENEITFYSKNN